jgi:hypothetical protein
MMMYTVIKMILMISRRRKKRLTIVDTLMKKVGPLSAKEIANIGAPPQSQMEGEKVKGL